MNGSVPDSQFGVAACCKLLGLLILSYLALVLVLGAFLESGRSIDLLIYLSGLSDGDLEIVQKIAVMILTPVLMMLVTFMVLRQYFYTEGLRSLLCRFGLGRIAQPGKLVLSFLIGLSMILSVKELMKFLPPGPFLQPTSAVNINDAMLWAKLSYGICAFTLIPIAEEFIFRGVLYEGFLASSNKIVAASAVSILFTAAHVELLAAGYWQNQILLLMVSVVLVVARQITGSLYSPIFIHSGFNFGSIFVVVE